MISKFIIFAAAVAAAQVGVIGGGVGAAPISTYSPSPVVPYSASPYPYAASPISYDGVAPAYGAYSSAPAVSYSSLSTPVVKAGYTGHYPYAAGLAPLQAAYTSGSGFPHSSFSAPGSYPFAAAPYSYGASALGYAAGAATYPGHATFNGLGSGTTW